MSTNGDQPDDTIYFIDTLENVERHIKRAKDLKAGGKNEHARVAAAQAGRELFNLLQ